MEKLPEDYKQILNFSINHKRKSDKLETCIDFFDKTCKNKSSNYDWKQY